MPELFIFLLKVNAALLLFCLGYYLVLRRLTFYTLNRIYLVIAILFSSLYPKINLAGFVQQHRQFTKPVQQIILNWKAPAEKLVKPLNQPNYWYLAEVIFWMGATLFAMRLAMQLFSLYRLYRKSKPATILNHQVRVIDGETGPFSFWKSIFINPDKLNAADLKSILQHEQVHVNEWHTLDILLAELSTVFYWFNPGIWFIKKAVRENIEFITDRKILQQGTDTKQYQYTMLSVNFATNPNPIVNHFNISTIKKRIIMMNAKRSSKFNLTRYAFVLPAVIVLLLTFSFSEAGIAKKSRDAFKNMAVSVSALKLVPTILLNTKSNIAVKPAIAKKIDTLTNSNDHKIAITMLSKDGKPLKDLAILYKFRLAKDTNGSWSIQPITDTAKNSKINVDVKKRLTVTQLTDKAADFNLDKLNGNVILAPPPANDDPAQGSAHTIQSDTARNGKLLLHFIFPQSSVKDSTDVFSNIAIVINGKQGSEKDLKKVLETQKIKTILVDSNNKSKSQYDDKTKNKVLIITTEK